jgi:hypothetical protein
MALQVNNMTGRICPFCGLGTDVPHESQEGCIQALHGEIARMRQVLDHVRSGGPFRHEPAEERDTA